MKGLSGKEIEVVSYLELNEHLFFTRSTIKKFFKKDKEITDFIYNLNKKGRIVRLNKSKYYLIPVKAYGGHWSEHPFIIVDEMFDGKDYCISGSSAAHYWGLIDQIPAIVEVHTIDKKPRRKKILGNDIVIKRRVSIEKHVRQEIKNHKFLILAKEETKRWLLK